MLYAFQDVKANKGNWKIIIVLVLFRIAQLLGNSNRFAFVIASPYLILYRVLVEWFFSIELHWKLNVGSGLKIYHGYCLVIHPNTVIGKNCKLRHCVTIGTKKSGEAPILGDNVSVGPNSVIIGNIKIGDNAVIGAGSVVVKDVPANCVVAGNPAKVIREEPCPENRTSAAQLRL